jgi:hypothetical protein
MPDEEAPRTMEDRPRVATEEDRLRLLRHKARRKRGLSLADAEAHAPGSPLQVGLRQLASRHALSPEDPFPPAETLRTVGPELPEEVEEEWEEAELSPAPSIAPSPLGPLTAEEDAMSGMPINDHLDIPFEERMRPLKVGGRTAYTRPSRYGDERE